MGRERELEQLESFLNAAAEGKGKTVLISGEAGSGKSCFTNEFLNVARKKGVAVMVGWCLSDAAVPYFPFVDAFNAYFASFEEEEALGNLHQPGSQFGLGNATQIGSEERAITTRLTGPRMVEKLGRPEAFSAQVWKDQTFAAVARTLHSISAQIPVVLLLEDIHWADSGSLGLLHYVARTINDSEKVLVLATFRGDELTADAEGRPHPLTETLRMMRREDIFSEIKLSNLNQTEVSKIAESMIGGHLQEEFAEKLARESRGNALFVVESLRMLFEQKSLIQEKNQWRLSVHQLDIPSKVKDIILHRLSMLKHDQRRILDAASVIGEKFSVELLASVIGQDELNVLETLSFISQSTSIVLDEGAFYRFDHARSREVLYDALPLSLRRGYHARIAEKLENAKQGGKLPIADLAYHYVEAGNEEKAVKYSLAAGQEALARCSNKEAIDSFEYVIQKVEDNPECFAEKTVALEGLGDALYANNNFSEARKTFERLAEIQKDKLKLRALRKAMAAAFYQNDTTKIRELIQLAEANALTDRVETAKTNSHKVRFYGFYLNKEDVGKLLVDSISVYEEEYCLADLAWDLFVASFGGPQDGELVKSVAAALGSLSLYEELGDVHSQLEALINAGWCFDFCTLRDEEVKMYLKVIEIDSKLKLNDYVRLIPAYSGLAYCFLWDDPERADVMIRKALEYFEKSEFSRISTVYQFLVVKSMIDGDVAKGEEYFEKLQLLPSAFLSSPIATVFSEQTKAMYFAGKKQFLESEKCFQNHFAFLKAYFASPGMEANAKRLYSWVLSKQGRMEEAQAMLKQVDSLTENAQKKFAHVNIHSSLITFTHPEVNQTFETRLDLINASRAQGSIIKVENLIVPELQILEVSPNCHAHDGYIEFKDGVIKPFEVKTIKLTVKAQKPEVFNLAPTVTYVNDVGETRTSSTRQFTITVKAAPQATQPKLETLPNRMPTGINNLDTLLYGGLPKQYAVALTAHSTDERELLIKSFLKAGVSANEIVFDITTDAGARKELAEKYPSDFYLLICNPQADTVQSTPNVFKLKGVENLTDIDIALTKAFRTLKPSTTEPRRICIDIISDVLLEHHAINTRRWLNALLPTLKSRGFTILGIVNPQMHPPEELQAMLGLFDGEIRISERETPEGTKQTLKIRRLYNQKYLENEITLTKKDLEQ